MDGKDGKSIRDILLEGTSAEQAMQAAVRQALRRHKQAGNPVCEWRDGQVVWIPPEEIVIPEEPGEQG